MDVSRKRQNVLALYERIGEEMNAGLGRSSLFAGSVYTHKVRCGKPGCRCAQGDERHEMICVSYVEDGHSRTRVVPENVRVELVEMTEAYRECRKAQRQMKELFDQLLAGLHELVEERCAKGKQRFARLTPKGGRQATKKGGSQ